jgi:hypothetical protein
MTQVLRAHHMDLFELQGIVDLGGYNGEPLI